MVERRRGEKKKRLKLRESNKKRSKRLGEKRIENKPMNSESRVDCSDGKRKGERGGRKGERRKRGEREKS